VDGWTWSSDLRWIEEERQENGKRKHWGETATSSGTVEKRTGMILVFKKADKTY